jgi:hypothetical protein
MPFEESERKTAVRVASDSFYALCQAFRASPKFERLAPATQNLIYGRASLTSPAGRIVSAACVYRKSSLRICRNTWTAGMTAGQASRGDNSPARARKMGRGA